MLQSHVIDVGGTFAGAAVRTADRYRFIAVDPRVEVLDQSEWTKLADVQRVVTHLLRTGQLPAPRDWQAAAALDQSAINGSCRCPKNRLFPT
jgi:bacillopeptidase F (M6 metalloprotease family)